MDYEGVFGAIHNLRMGLYLREEFPKGFILGIGWTFNDQYSFGDEMSVHFSSMTDEWKTPTAIYQKLNAEFKFDFDPCPIGGGGYGIDGLQINWGKSNFVNPPYSQLKAWCKKSYEESLLGKTVVMLIPSRTDTSAWHDYCMKADEIRFIRGRLKFGDSKNSAPFPSAIIIFNRHSGVTGDSINSRG